MKHVNAKQECKFKNNLKEQTEMIKLLIFSIGIYLNILTQEMSGGMLLQNN